MKDYIYLRAYETMYGSDAVAINLKLDRARKEKAPWDAVAPQSTPTVTKWVLFKELPYNTRMIINQVLVDDYEVKPDSFNMFTEFEVIPEKTREEIFDRHKK